MVLVAVDKLNELELFGRQKKIELFSSHHFKMMAVKFTSIKALLQTECIRLNVNLKFTENSKSEKAAFSAGTILSNG